MDIKKIELKEIIHKLIFKQTFSNADLACNVKRNIEELLTKHKELNDYKCKVETSYNGPEIEVINKYYPESVDNTLIEKCKRFSNWYNEWAMLLITAFLPITLSVIITCIISVSLFVYLALIILLYAIATSIFYRLHKTCIGKTFKSVHTFKYKLNISRNEYEFLAHQLFDDIWAIDCYSISKSKFLNLIYTACLYCQYIDNNGNKLTTAEYIDNTEIILEFTIYDYKYLDEHNKFISKVEMLLDVYNNNISKIKCKI